MKLTKKSLRWIVDIVVLLLAVVLVFCSRRPLVRSKDTVIVSSVYYLGEDVTWQLDEDELIDDVEKLTRGAYIDFAGSYIMKDYPLEINLIVNNDPLHIVLGQKKSFCYESGDKMQASVGSAANVEKLIDRIMTAITE